MKRSNCALAWALMLLSELLLSAAPSAPLRTDFPYHGWLSEGGHPANGGYDLRLRLFDADTEGEPIGETLYRSAVRVTNGVLNLTLDFGDVVLTTRPLWLEVGVHAAQSTVAYTVLSPRQPLTPVPLALYAVTVGNVLDASVTSAKLAPGAVTSTGIQDRAVTGDKIALGQVVRSLNLARDDVVLQGGSNVTVTTSGNTVTIELKPEGLNPNAARQVTTTSRDGTVTHYASLYVALLAARDGDTIRVYANQQVIAQRVYDGAHPEWAGLFLTNRSDITIEGVGFPTISSESYGDFLYVKNCTNVVITGLAFNGAGPSPAELDVYCMINFGGTNKCLTVRNCRFTNFGDQGVAHLWGNKTSSFVTIEDCYFARGGTTRHPTLGIDGAAIAGVGYGWKVLNNVIEDCLRGVEIEGEGPSKQAQILIAHNTLNNIWSEGICLFATSLASSNYTDIVVEANHITGKGERPPGVSYQAGISFQGGERIIILNNTVSDMPQGFVGIALTSGTVDIRDCVIQGNIIKAIGARGIQLAAVFSNRVDSCVISGNQVLQCGDRGIIVSGCNHLVTSNIAHSNQGAGIDVYVESGVTDLNTINNNVCYSNSTYGISVRANATNTFLLGNNCFGNTQGQVHADPQSLKN